MAKAEEPAAKRTSGPGTACPTLTTQQGAPVADDQTSLKQGARGPFLLEDQHFREKIFHFDHERIPERVVHARGYGAHGFFELTESLADVTRADVFQRVGERVPAFVRFSTVIGSKGRSTSRATCAGSPSSSTPTRATGISSATTSRCSSSRTRSSSPTWSTRPSPSPTACGRRPQTAHDNFWDFISLTPESMHMIMWTMSDRAIPAILPLHGRLRGPHLPPARRRGKLDFRQVSLEAAPQAPVGGVERGGQDQRG